MTWLRDIEKHLREESEYKKAKKHVEDCLKSKSFTLDTNILVLLAEFNDKNLLDWLVKAPGFVLTSTNTLEIRGLLKGDFIAKNAKMLLTEFLERALKSKKASKIHYDRFVKELEPLTALLPRKLVHDVLITDKDSFVNNLMEKYAAVLEKMKKGGIKDKDLIALRKDYLKEVEGLKGKLEKRFTQLCKKLNVDELRIDRKRYFEHVDIFKHFTVNDITKLVKKYVANIPNLVMEFRLIADKQYKSDVKFVAETLARGAEGKSLDSDVIILLELHSVKFV